jgi:hypothetical protein
MPTINRYASKEGLYIRSARSGRISTFQVSPEGERTLLSWGCYPGHDISVEALDYLIDNGLVYTHGGGPGQIDMIPVPNEGDPKPSAASVADHRRVQDSEAQGCAIVLVLILLGRVDDAGAGSVRR